MPVCRRTEVPYCPSGRTRIKKELCAKLRFAYVGGKAQPPWGQLCLSIKQSEAKAKRSLAQKVSFWFFFFSKKKNGGYLPSLARSSAPLSS